MTESLSRPAYHLVRVTEGGAALVDALTALPAGSFVDARVPTAEVNLTDGLIDKGFRVVDTSIMLDRPWEMRLGRDPHCRFAEANDREHVSRIAREGFSTSRFHLDPKIDDHLARALKGRWAEGYFQGTRGEWMVVAQDGVNVVGFLQLLSSGPKLVIDLIAVSEEARRRGLAAEMIEFASRRCGSFETMEVGTQVSNIASIRLYESLAFRVRRTDYVLHRHGWNSGSQR